MSRITSLSEWLLRQAAVWGSLAYLAFFALVVRTSPAESWLVRYFDGHWIKYATGILFFIGLASLAIRLMRLVVEQTAIERTRLSAPPADGQSAEACGELLRELDGMAGPMADTYLTRRLREALQYVHQKKDADTLEAHLRHLEDVDLGRMHQGYGSVRIIVNVIPILGFLGTVLGITLAIARLDADSMEAALPAVIDGLAVAFDTTGLSLSLSMVLLGVKFLVERVEYRLISRVDAIAGETLVGRFQQYGSQTDPHVATVKRMCEETLQTVQAATAAQAEALEYQLAKSDRRLADTLASTAAAMCESFSHVSEQVAGSVSSSASAWEAMALKVGASLRESVTAAMNKGMVEHAETLNRGVGKMADDLRAMLISHAEILSEGCDQYGLRMVESLEGQTSQLTGALQTPVNELATALEALTTVLPAALEGHTAGLAEALEHHTAILKETETQLADENRRHLSDVEAALGEAMLVSATRQEQAVKQSEELLKEMQLALVEGAGATVAQQEQLVKQGEVLLRVVEATGQVRQLEESLNRNLESLAASRNLQEVMVNLSATLHLLNARLGDAGHVVPRVSLAGDKPHSQAA